MAKHRKGNQEPTQSYILPGKKSSYKEAVEIYQRSGRKAQIWQKNILKNILTKKGKLWTHTKFGYSVPRRNGKNEVVVMREMYGLINGEKILHTAHRTTTSHAAWERLVTLLDQAKIEYTSLRAAGRERIELEDGGRCEFRTRSSKGGLGEGFDLLIVDEAQEYTDDQESALKYVVTDSKNPQTIFCGTPPTPYSTGTVFTKMRRSCLNGELKNTGWVEWSVDEISDCEDIELWYLTNPSLGTVFTERSVSDEIGTDNIDFNIQRLGLWIKHNQKSAISLRDWNKLQVDTLPKFKGKLYVGIKYGHDGTNVAMSIALKTIDDDVFIEVVDCQSVRNGTNWIIAFLKKANVEKVVIDGANGQSILTKAMKFEKIRNPILPTVKEFINANSSFEQGIYSETIKHKGQPSLEEIASNCEKRPIGSNGGFGYKSIREGAEIALLDSAILAHWACLEAKPFIRQKISY